MRVGFIHGVMNTDNMSIPGETIDYGPCAFMNAYNPNTVFSSIDRNGRYSFGNQPKILHWNLAVFANTLLPLISDNEEESIELVKEKLDKFSSIFSYNWYDMMYQKLGILNPVDEDRALVDSLLKIMRNYNLDYTNTFATLTINNESDDIFKIDEFKNWKAQWECRINFSNNCTENFKLMKRQNPLVIPRNHLVESALDNSEDGNFNQFNDLLHLLSDPYEYKSNFNLQNTPAGFDDSYKTYCGT